MTESKSRKNQRNHDICSIENKLSLETDSQKHKNFLVVKRLRTTVFKSKSWRLVILSRRRDYQSEAPKKETSLKMT